MCLALQEGVALPKHLFWAALSLWQNGWGMWIPFHRRALSSVLRGIWRCYARCRYRESYCLAVCQISWMSIAMESKLLFGFDRWGHENEEVHGEPCPWFIAGPLPPKMMKFPFDRIGKFTSCRIRMLRCTTSSKLSACSCSVMGFHKLHVLSFFIAQLPLLCLIYSSNTVASKNQNCQISNIDKMMPSCLVFASSLKRFQCDKGWSTNRVLPPFFDTWKDICWTICSGQKWKSIWKTELVALRCCAESVQVEQELRAWVFGSQCSIPLKHLYRHFFRWTARSVC